MIPSPTAISIVVCLCFFFFNDTATTEIYTLSLHDALPIYNVSSFGLFVHRDQVVGRFADIGPPVERSEEHTSELQSQSNLVCRLLLEKKKNSGRMVLAAEGRKTHDSHSDCSQYLCVPESGT